MNDRSLPNELRSRAAARHRAKVLALVRPWRAEGATLDECCRRLAEMGIQSFYGRRWRRHYLCRLLKSAQPSPGSAPEEESER